MGEDVVNRAASLAGLPGMPSITSDLKIHGSQESTDISNPHYWYGSDLDQLRMLIKKDPEMGEIISEKLHIFKAQVTWAIREEMARSVEDFLARRTRALQLDARESIQIAPRIAQIMAIELGYNSTWEKRQLEEYTSLASGYLLSN